MPHAESAYGLPDNQGAWTGPLPDVVPITRLAAHGRASWRLTGPRTARRNERQASTRRQIARHVGRLGALGFCRSRSGG